MGAGLIIFNEGGTLEITEATRLVRFLGEPFDTGTTSGFRDYGEWVQGQPIFFPFYTRSPDEYWSGPIFNISGARLSWYFPSGKNPISTRVVVGVSA